MTWLSLMNTSGMGLESVSVHGTTGLPANLTTHEEGSSAVLHPSKVVMDIGMTKFVMGDSVIFTQLSVSRHHVWIKFHSDEERVAEECQLMSNILQTERGDHGLPNIRYARFK